MIHCPHRIGTGARRIVRGVCLAVFAVFGASAAVGQIGDAAGPLAGDGESSVVTLDITATEYSYLMPWDRSVKQVRKTGVVIDRNQILTTAAGLENHTLIRLQKRGRGVWRTAEAVWIDFAANLALVTSRDADFWNDLRPLALSGPVRRPGQLRIKRWREGKLESRVAEFNQYTVRAGSLSDVHHVQLQIDSDIEGAGGSEPVFSSDAFIGLASGQDGKQVTVIPSVFIQSILDARERGDYRGLGYFDFVWQQSDNPASLDYLGLPGAPRGVIVIEAAGRSAGESPLKAKDIILSIDGFDIDIQGDYLDPDYGYLMLENLSSRGKWIGDTVNLTVWRDGRSIQVPYTLPPLSAASNVLGPRQFDEKPPYLIAGGLIFQPLTLSFLSSWGPDWVRRAPFRLGYYRNQKTTPDRTGLVLLSRVLPDPFNVGYQDNSFLVLDKVNGVVISDLADLNRAFTRPEGGYHVIDFVRGDSLRRMVVDAVSMAGATRRVLERYGIEEPFVAEQEAAPEKN